MRGNPIGWVDPFGLQTEPAFQGGMSADPVQFGSMAAGTGDLDGDGDLDLVIPDPSGVTRYMVFSAEPEGDRTFMPSDTLDMGTIDEIIAAIKRRLLADNTTGLQTLYIDAHNGVSGTVIIARDLSINYQDAIILSQGTAGGWPESVVKDAQRKREKFRELTSLIAQDGLIHFVQCDSGSGERGAALLEFLGESSDNRVNIQLWQHGVRWFFGEPMGEVNWPWIPWGGKSKNKTNGKTVTIG